MVNVHLASNVTPMQAQELLQSASKKTRELIEIHKLSKEQLASIRKQWESAIKDVQQLTVEKEMLLIENRELKEQIKTIKLAQSLSSGSGDQNSRQVKTKINEYIREIDKCLSLLNRE